MNIVRSMSNAAVMAGLRLGLPVAPYTRANGLIVETVGRRSGKRRRTPVGYAEEDGRIIVVVENGARADYVRNALAHEGRLRVFHRGAWKDARLRLLEDDPEPYLQRMSRTHAAAVRRFGSELRAAEIVPD